MKIKLLLFLTLLCVGNLWADEWFTTISTQSTKAEIIWEISTKGEVNTYGKYIVIKDSQTYTLDEFFKSGLFCKERGGHKWKLADIMEDCFGWKCFLCGRCRQKIKVSKTVEEWEE